MNIEEGVASDQLHKDMKLEEYDLVILGGGTGSTITYAELDLRSRKLAGYLSANRIAKGDHIAIMMANSLDYLAVCWAAQRLGLVYTPINWHLTSPETAYILENSDAKALIVSEHVHPALEIISQSLRRIEVGLTTGPSFGAFKNLNHVLECVGDIPDLGHLEGRVTRRQHLEDDRHGQVFLFPLLP